MRRSGFQRQQPFVFGILIWITLFVCHAESLRGSAVVLQAKAKLAEPKPVPQSDDEVSVNGTSVAAVTNSTKPQLTGIPQIDYIHDPNLPRELNGFNLTDYPFFNELPEKINFKCDGLHDGFYASVLHKCQVYHHCLFGTRFDFLCANYTAFDQKTFICHFVSEVDCVNSPKYFKRNEALYKEATTTTGSTTTTTTVTPAPSTSATAGHSYNGGPRQYGGAQGRRRRPYRRRRPMYEYYYDDEEYPESEYYEDEIVPLNHRRASSRKQNKDVHESQDSDVAEYDDQPSDQVKPANRASPSISSSVYERPRAAPKIRRPVPKNERDRYEYVKSAAGFASTASSPATAAPKKPSSTPAPSAPAADDEYYDEDEEYEYEKSWKFKSKPQLQHHPDYDLEEDSRHVVARHRPRQPVRKRTDVYDDYDVVQDRPRMNRRKEYNSRYDDRPRGRPTRGKNRQQQPADDHGGYKSRRRPEKRTHVEDDYYYDDEEKEEELPPKRGRPSKSTEKPKPTSKASSTPPPPHHSKTPKPIEETESITRYWKQGGLRTAKANVTEHETQKHNGIATTESLLGTRVNDRPKTVKILNNSIRDDAEDPENVSTEEVSSTTNAARTASPVKPARPDPRRPTASQEQIALKPNTSTVRHFVAAAPMRKPSHYIFSNPLPNITFKEPLSPPPPPPPTAPNQIYKAPFSSFYVPKVKVAQPEHLTENLNSISAVNFNSPTFITEAKPFETTKPQPYRQEQRVYSNGPAERLFPNVISFPRRPPPNYDITAPGPSASAEEPSTKQKLQELLPPYTANGDYDPTYNDALQPSTLHPVRRYPSTAFYMQTPSRRHIPSEYSNDGVFRTPNRSHNPYK